MDWDGTQWAGFSYTFTDLLPGTNHWFTFHCPSVTICREAGGDTLLPTPRLDDNWQLLFDPHLWRVLHRVLELAQLGNVWRHQLHRVTGHTAGKE